MSKKKDHWNFKQTLGGLRYIANSPPPEYGGFHPTTLAIATGALYHIRRLQRKMKSNINPKLIDEPKWYKDDRMGDW